jgi:PleD family two-component response regulator
MSKRILIIDEDIVELNRLSQILGCQGYDVCPLSRSYKVFTEITRCQPDLILLDSKNTEMNSYTVSRALKAIDAAKDIPLMLISGKTAYSANYASKQQEDKQEIVIETNDIDCLLKDIRLRLAS